MRGRAAQAWRTLGQDERYRRRRFPTSAIRPQSFLKPSRTAAAGATGWQRDSGRPRRRYRGHRYLQSSSPRALKASLHYSAAPSA